jgi:hypothetical protein
MKTINFFKFGTIAFTAMAMMAACGEKGPEDGGSNKDPDDEIPVITSAIEIDGDFSDWDALSATEAPTATYTAHTESSTASQLKVVRAYVDENYISVYAEYVDTPDKIYTMHVHFDTDNSQDTGTTLDDGAWYFDAGEEFLAEGQIRDMNVTDSDQYLSYDPGIHSWFEEEGYFGTVDLASGSGVGQGSTPVKLTNGNMAIEVQLTKELFPSTIWGSKMGIGVDIANLSWAEVGRVPNNADATAAPMLIVPVSESESAE